MIYKYCGNFERSNLELTCEKEYLTELDSYFLREGKLKILIYKCSKCGGLWKMIEYKNVQKWLQVNEVVSNEYAPFETQNYFPVEYFEIAEVYFYDNSVQCGNPKECEKYSGLTCSLKSLTFVEKIQEGDAGCYSIKEETYVCDKCKNRWALKEEFDSHHGYARSAKRIN
ncbi:hypothetical protein [Flavobacterium sharifuzzamanii]|uniref:hypothetical protein n=1 Tax=Flavobacterium sharifuzzamanii TaxID=2211133 RepID=UPI000DAF11DD|nr:hypothetical protein [Flavobacterium sharifuzzamanii]KAF2082853.1 hypothetical protein DMA14_01610 [Flavobacterium sharifuzzamanii]